MLLPSCTGTDHSAPLIDRHPAHSTPSHFMLPGEPNPMHGMTDTVSLRPFSQLSLRFWDDKGSMMKKKLILEVDELKNQSQVYTTKLFKKKRFSAIALEFIELSIMKLLEVWKSYSLSDHISRSESHLMCSYEMNVNTRHS